MDADADGSVTKQEFIIHYEKWKLAAHSQAVVSHQRDLTQQSQDASPTPDTPDGTSPAALSGDLHWTQELTDETNMPWSNEVSLSLS